MKKRNSLISSGRGWLHSNKSSTNVKPKSMNFCRKKNKTITNTSNNSMTHSKPFSMISTKNISKWILLCAKAFRREGNLFRLHSRKLRKLRIQLIGTSTTSTKTMKISSKNCRWRISEMSCINTTLKSSIIITRCWRRSKSTNPSMYIFPSMSFKGFSKKLIYPTSIGC